MKVKARQSGLTLMEMTVVIAVVALLAVFGLPAIRALVNSFESEGGAKAMISASLASARAIAAKEQRYAGVRFQNAYNPDDPDSLKSSQYMIFIVYDDEISKGFGQAGNLGCRVAEGIQPIKLPNSVGVMEVVNGDSEIYDSEVTDKTTFSILFSPSGKLVIHDFWVKGRNDDDDVFNSKANISNKRIGMFLEDSYQSEGLEKELSRNSFIIYDKTEFNKVDRTRRYDDYLRHLEVIYINPYTGTMIER